MGRWTQYDEDDYRLPEGMRRVGYDADTGRYYFRDRDGTLWAGEPGAQFGEMKQVDNAPDIVLDVHEEAGDLEAASERADGYKPVATDERGYLPHLPRLSPSSPWRTLFPFLMVIVVCLLLVWRLVHPSFVSLQPDCSGSTVPYEIKTGDTCWDISESHHVSLEDLLRTNQGLACEKLAVGQTICLPKRN